MRNVCLQDNHPVMVEVMGACPKGDGFKAKFENFSIKHLPDLHKVQWLEKKSGNKYFCLFSCKFNIFLITCHSIAFTSVSIHN